MKRIWFGVGLLLGMLAVGILLMQVMDRQLAEISAPLKQASEERNWDRALSLAQTAQQEWERKWHIMAALTDHADLDTVDELFARLEVYRQHRSQTDHAVTCAQLSEAIRSLGETFRFNWWNLL